MDIPAAFMSVLTNWGPAGAIIAILLWQNNRVVNKLFSVIENNTRVLTELTSIIESRVERRSAQ